MKHKLGKWYKCRYYKDCGNTYLQNTINRRCCTDPECIARRQSTKMKKYNKRIKG